MSYTKIGKFVQKISEMTRAGKIKWEETGSEGVYMATLGNYSVSIEARTSWGDGINYNMGIYNAQGVLIEEVSDETLKADISNAFALMQDLYVAARRIAMGVEDALDDMLDSLDEEGGGF